MFSSVTFRQLQKTLNELGFDSEGRGGHVLFRHIKTGVVLTVPQTKENIRPIYISTAARQIANSGIATTSTFESKLAKAAKELNRDAVHKS